MSSTPAFIDRRFWLVVLSFTWLAATGYIPAARAETGHEAWLRYAPITDAAVKQSYASLPRLVVWLDDSPVENSAGDEVVRGLQGMLGLQARSSGAEARPGQILLGLGNRSYSARVNLAENAIVLGTLDTVKRLNLTTPLPTDLTTDGFWLTHITLDGHNHILITAPNDRGVLYGVFALLRKISLHEPVAALDLKDNPYAPVRMLNQWDNLDGTIERGYGGLSIFWDGNHATKDLARVGEFARLCASVGINGIAINNVNADSRVVTPEYLTEVQTLAAALRPWGVRLLISLDFASPRKVGGIDSFDPLDPRAVAFWKDTVDRVYTAIPDLAGFVLKADSEGRLGPSVYHRTHADAANVIARALQPHGGILFYRGFVYDNQLDWRVLTNDRAKAAYDNFHGLDGQFEDNVIVQIKNGPIDFQVREPPSPLFGGLAKTNMAVELQITQEYLGQQRQVVFTVPMWKTTLDFDLQAKGPGTPVKALASGKVFGQKLGGFVGVSNVGREPDWLGLQLAQANLYGFGRLAWNPDLGNETIATEWVKQTFGDDPLVVATVLDILLKSWKAYEDYTGNLGIGGLTDIISVHYGPAVESSERNGWGQWHRSDKDGTGMNRTVADGTGFIGQYSAPVAQMFESLATCPDDLLLFFHHVPYTQLLHDGQTVIQHIYDAHYAGAEQAAKFAAEWRGLKGKIDNQRYQEVLDRLEYQAGYAVVWRDAVTHWFHATSGIPDAQNRVDNHPTRTEAENMTLDGYVPQVMTPFEAASGEQYAKLISPDGKGSVFFNFKGAPGVYDIVVQYFDQLNGQSKFTLVVANQPRASWVADDLLPTPYNAKSTLGVNGGVNAHTSTRHVIHNVPLKTGDEIRVDAVRDGDESAAIDYVEVNPAAN